MFHLDYVKHESTCNAENMNIGIWDSHITESLRTSDLIVNKIWCIKCAFYWFDSRGNITSFWTLTDPAFLYCLRLSKKWRYMLNNIHKHEEWLTGMINWHVKSVNNPRETAVSSPIPGGTRQTWNQELCSEYLYDFGPGYFQYLTWTVPYVWKKIYINMLRGFTLLIVDVHTSSYSQRQSLFHQIKLKKT